MDAYTVYLNTFRYVMNADYTVKSSWSDIFKYLPSLRRMLSCAVCGNILRNPHGATNGVCLHHVCYKCLGGKMLLKPSCSWCKDHTSFKENKKLRVLILCFKRLCAYISNSRLGTAINALSLNGHDNEVENLQNALNDAEQFEDDYELTPPPVEPLVVLKQRVREHKFPFSEYKPTASTSGFVRKSNNNHHLFPQQNTKGVTQKPRGRRKKSLPNITLKPSPKSNATIHVKRLKRKALNTSRRKATVSKSLKIDSNSKSAKTQSRHRNLVSTTQGDLLISQRPHRQLSGKFSVGQLWRETFLEERLPEPEVYPDSGIEVGNSSDQDHGSQSPNSATQQIKVKDEKSSSQSTTAPSEAILHPIRDTRLHPISTDVQKDDKTAPATNVFPNTIKLSDFNDVTKQKPKLTLKIPKKRFRKICGKRSIQGTFLRKIAEEEVIPSPKLVIDRENSESKYSGPGIRTRIKDSLKQRKDICRCARFKRPNQLTCFGQKCPCYRDRKPCVNCLCNGCKNPRRPSSDSAPPLMHMTKTTKDSQCLSPDLDLSMPRLSPIPRM